MRTRLKLSVALAAHNGLRTVHLGDNLFDDPRGGEGQRRMTRLRRACDWLRVDCTGLPPLSCTAFGPRFALSVAGDVCVKCPSEGERVLLVCLVAFAAAALLALVMRFARLVRKYRTRVRYMTTALIFVNHVQNLALIGSMQVTPEKDVCVGWSQKLQEH